MANTELKKLIKLAAFCSLQYRLISLFSPSLEQSQTEEKLSEIFEPVREARETGNYERARKNLENMANQQYTEIRSCMIEFPSKANRPEIQILYQRLEREYQRFQNQN
jgi:hypothetical protein